MYAINYDGLRKRDTYNELIDYIQFGQEKITYPDRFAKRVRESPQISNLLDGEGLGKGDMEEQQLNHMKEILKEFAVREAGGTAQFARAAEPPPPPPGPPPAPPGFAAPGSNPGSSRDGATVPPHPAPHYDDDLQDQAERVSEVTRESFSARYKRNQNTADRNRDNLNGVAQQQWQGHGLGIDGPKTIKQIQKTKDYYRERRNPLSKSKQVNRDNVKLFQKKSRDNELTDKRTGPSIEARMEQNTQQFDNTGPYDRGGGQHERYANRHAGFKKSTLPPKPGRDQQARQRAASAEILTRKRNPRPLRRSSLPERSNTGFMSRNTPYSRDEF